MNANRLGPLVLTLLIQGCNACWITKPANPIETVTLFEVKFHRYFQPGTFSALLDGENVTAQFTPAPAQSGLSTMVRNQSFLGGEGPGYINPPPVQLGPGGQVPPSDQRSPPPFDRPQQREHTLKVSCDCIPEATCGHGDSLSFYPLHFSVSPSSTLNLPPGGAAYNLTLGTDRPLNAPVVVTVSAHVLGSTTAPANHISVNGATPGTPATVTLVPGGGVANLFVQATSAGGFWLRFDAPGAQVASVTGVAQ